MILVKAVRLVCGVCMIPAVAACGDAMGPRLADPSRITAKLDAVSGVFHSPVFARHFYSSLLTTCYPRFRQG